jgi:acyl-CoA thioester hydrolase
MSVEANETEQGPLVLIEGEVQPEWIDYNGHMNVAYYLLAFDQAYDAFMEMIGMGRDFREATGGSTFSAEIHIKYLRELTEGEPYRIIGQMLGSDAKRMHLFLRMYSQRGGELAATMEGMNLYVDLSIRKVVAMPDSIMATLAKIQAAHDKLPRPPEAGRGIAMPPPKAPAGGSS